MITEDRNSELRCNVVTAVTQGTIEAGGIVPPTPNIELAHVRPDEKRFVLKGDLPNGIPNLLDGAPPGVLEQKNETTPFYTGRNGPITTFRGSVFTPNLLRGGDDYDDAVYDSLDSVGMMVCGLSKLRKWNPDTHDKAKDIVNNSFKKSFRLLHELDHFSTMTLGTRREDITQEHTALVFYQASQYLNTDPAAKRMLDHLHLQEAIICEAEDRIYRILGEAKTDLKTLADRESANP